MNKEQLGREMIEFTPLRGGDAAIAEIERIAGDTKLWGAWNLNRRNTKKNAKGFVKCQFKHFESLEDLVEKISALPWDSRWEDKIELAIFRTPTEARKQRNLWDGVHGYRSISEQQSMDEQISGLGDPVKFFEYITDWRNCELPNCFMETLRGREYNIENSRREMARLRATVRDYKADILALNPAPFEDIRSKERAYHNLWIANRNLEEAERHSA